MKKYFNIKKIYLFTFLSIIATILFIYVFTGTAEQFYTGWDNHTNKNTLSVLADVMFILLLSVNFLGIILCIIYHFRKLFTKLSSKNQPKE